MDNTLIKQKTEQNYPLGEIFKMARKREKSKNWIMVSVVLAIALIICLSFLIFQRNGETFDNKQSMQEICNKIGGEPYLYKVGWSSTCGFDIYRGTCVQFGQVLDPQGYLLVDGTRFSFQEINDMPDIEGGTMDEEDMQKWEQWEKDVCQKFQEARK